MLAGEFDRGKRQPEIPYGRDSLSMLLRDLWRDNPHPRLVFTAPDWTYRQNVDEQDVTPEEFELLTKMSSRHVPILIRGNRKDQHVLNYPYFRGPQGGYYLTHARFAGSRTLVTMTEEQGKNACLSLSGTYGIPEVREKLRDVLDPAWLVWARRTAGRIGQRLQRLHGTPRFF